MTDKMQKPPKRTGKRWPAEVGRAIAGLLVDVARRRRTEADDKGNKRTGANPKAER